MYESWTLATLSQDETGEWLIYLQYFAEQAECLKKYLKAEEPAMIYHISVGNGAPAIREVLKKGDWNK